MKATLEKVSSSHFLNDSHKFLDKLILNDSSSSGGNDTNKTNKSVYLLVNGSFLTEALISEQTLLKLNNNNNSNNITNNCIEAEFVVGTDYLDNILSGEVEEGFILSIDIQLYQQSNIPILDQIIVQPISISNNDMNHHNHDDCNQIIQEWISEHEYEFLHFVKNQISTILTRFHTFSIMDHEKGKLIFQIVDSSPTRQGLIDSEKTRAILFNTPTGGATVPERIFNLSTIEMELSCNDDDNSLLEEMLSSDFIEMKNQKAKTISTSNIKSTTTDTLCFYIEKYSISNSNNSSNNSNNNGSSNSENTTTDPYSTILLSSKLFAKLDCFDNTWVKLNNTHTVLICVIHGQKVENDEDIILTNSLYFNMGKPSTIHITTNEHAPKVASKIVLTPIQSPNHFGTNLIEGTEEEQQLEQKLFGKQLEIFFSQKRALRKNDIILVNNPTIDFIKSEDSVQVQVLAQLEASKRLDPIHGDHTCYRVDTIECGGGGQDETDQTLCIINTETAVISNSQPGRGYIPTDIKEDYDNQVSGFKKLCKMIEPIMSIHKQQQHHHSSTNRSNQRNLVQQHFLIHGEEGSGKTHSIHSICTKYGFHLIEINAFEFIDESDAITAQNLSHCFTLARQCTPCVFYVKHFEAFDQLSNGNSSDASVKQHSKIRIVKCLKQCLKSKNNPYPLIFIPSVSSLELLSPVFKNIFLTKIEFKRNLSEEERELFLQKNTTDIKSICNIDLSTSHIVKQTSGCSVHDLNNIVQISKTCAIVESMQNVQRYYNFQNTSDNNNNNNSNGASSSSPIRMVDTLYTSTLSHKHFMNGGMKWLKKYSVAGKDGATTNLSIPTVKWQDIGGLEHAKQEILDIIQSPLQSHSHLKTRSGVLLYGPPGCGKTLLAKAVATECQLNFMSVKGPELINMYVGESERNVRVVFERARQAKPCVVFFDELDALAPNRGASGDSGGVSDRVVSQLLAELDDISNACDVDEKDSSASNKGVFVIGATNRPDLIDPALLRPGRFERLVYLGVSKTHQDQLKVLNALTRKFNLSDDVNLEILLEGSGGFNLTGADFYAICTDAFMNAVSRATCEGDDISNKQSHQIIVCQEDFEKAFNTITPSVSVSDLERYESLQNSFN